jgi:hypothetical protein
MGDGSQRWSDYFIERDFSQFWAGRLREPGASACVLLGSGFDPRASLGLLRLQEVCDPAQLACVVFRFRPPKPVGPHAEQLANLSLANADRLDGVGVRRLLTEEVALYDASGHPTGSRGVLSSVLKLLPELGKFRDVIVDISGMPRTIFFPLLAYLCREADLGKLQNLHVAVSESPTVDAAVKGLEYGAADYVYPFQPASARQKLVWLPVVAENEGVRLQRVHDLLKGDCIEICPVVPFPSSTLRRSDDIIMSLREVLFENFAISKNNILLCHESTPFDVYRKVLQIDDYYRDRVASLPELGEVATVVSPPSSKMLSLGTLLAAIERRLRVCHVGARAYTLSGGDVHLEDTSSTSTTTEVWLTGEPYKTAGPT